MYHGEKRERERKENESDNQTSEILRQRSEEKEESKGTRQDISLS